MNVLRKITVGFGVLLALMFVAWTAVLAYDGYRYALTQQERQAAPVPRPVPAADYTYVITKHADASTGLVCYWLQPRDNVSTEKGLVPIGLGCGPDLSPYESQEQRP